MRFDHALVLLKESALSVTDIAMAVGFSDSAYFTKKFKEEFHITPLAFRKGKYEVTIKRKEDSTGGMFSLLGLLVSGGTGKGS